MESRLQADLVLNAVIRLSEYDKAVIVSGDGDFYCLIKYLKDHDKLRMVLVPDEQKYSALLKDFGTGFLTGVSALRVKLEYMKRTP